mmetsp:Transcript_72507/g.187046  ORF Transcript_72507/g.187046 Transcript_72507/m.187046 type:complete len:323 (+) Transcript_72507:335-1303(+)
MSSMMPPLPQKPRTSFTAASSAVARTSDSKRLVALCNKLLQGCRSMILKQRGSNCSRMTASRTALCPVLVSIVMRFTTSSVVPPMALIVPMGIAMDELWSRAASRRRRMRGKCVEISCMSEVLRPWSHDLLSPAWAQAGEGERGGEGGALAAISSSAPTLTMSSSPLGMGGGASGDNVGVWLALLPPPCSPVGETSTWKTMLERIAVAGATRPGLPPKIWSTRDATVSQDVNCLKSSSLKQIESFCDRSSRTMSVTFSCVSLCELVSSLSLSSSCATRRSSEKTFNESCSTHRKRANSSAKDLRCSRSRNRCIKASAPRCLR